MNFPNIIRKQKSELRIWDFLGLNETDITNEKEFSEMENISSDLFPAVACRHKRGEVIKVLQKPNGIFWKNRLYWFDGDQAGYQDEQGNILSINYPKRFEDSRKTLVGMGAYICVFPDKVMIDTTTNKVLPMEDYMRTEVTAAPVSEASTFTRISASGIERSFHKGDAVTISGFPNGSPLNGTKIVQDAGEGYIVVVAKIEGMIRQTNAVFERKVPDMDFVCEMNNRIYGCSSKNHEIYACKLGDPRNWNCFEGLSTDSYAVTIGSDGDFTGCITHQGYVVFFKEDVIHTIYGTKPSNFQIDTIQARGVAKGCERSLTRVNESVFYASRNEICQFEGSTPESISDKLKIRYKKAVGDRYNGKYYLSLQDKKDKWHLYVFDAKRSGQYQQQLWYREDNLEIKESCYGEGVLYIIDGENKVREIVDEEKYSDKWELTSGRMKEGTFDKKRVHKLKIDLWLERGSSVDVFVRYDESPEWIQMKTIYSAENQTYSIPVKIRRCGHYQYRLSGHGRFELFGMSRVVEGGSDR